MKRIYCLLLFVFGIINPVFAQEVYQAHTHVRLVSEQDAVAQGEVFWVGFDLMMDDGWHVYWQNPGDSGLAPKIKWELQSGINVRTLLNYKCRTSNHFEKSLIKINALLKGIHSSCFLSVAPTLQSLKR